MPRKKNISAEIENAAMEVSVIADAGEKPKRKAGRPPKAKSADKAVKAAKRSAKKAAETPKKKPGRPARKKLEEAIAAVEVTEAPKKRRGRPAKNAAAEAPKKAGRPAKKAVSADKEEIIDKIIAADFTGSGTGNPFDLSDEEAKVLKAFVKALTKTLNE